ncbi:uncharacterized protein LOC129779577 [Toxorhynchites rutilus septentrionalis]|uniref:uncharacterized protein LOC129779577 n=1 Tax=Toxorhynchites rutilus septentrionalis TaxID=329112 RepID=UPI00247B0C26|nr:uncharacterized protein LOC129779577 [Toxorhynchites rutilus septentrionalis]
MPTSSHSNSSLEPRCTELSFMEAEPDVPKAHRQYEVLRSFPRRNTLSTMEAPSTSVTVAPYVDENSRSLLGPVYGIEEGDFQPAIPGKYSSSHNISVLHESLVCSDLVQEAPVVNDLVIAEHQLKIYYQNVRGLRTKIDDFFLAAQDSCYDVIVLTETWLDDRIQSTQLFGSLYTVFRTDRSPKNSAKSRGGGVLIAASCRLSCCLDPTPVCDTLEQLWIRIKTPTGNASIGVIYLPPDRIANVIDIKNHISSLEAILSNLNVSDSVIQFGDYNQSNLVWSSLPHHLPVIDILQSRFSPSCLILLDGLSLNGLTQIKPIANQNSRILDFALVNDNIINRSTVCNAAEPLIELDRYHPALELTVEMQLPTVFVDVIDLQSLDFNRADYNLLRERLLEIDWQTLEIATSKDDAVDYFNEKVNQAIANCVPLRRHPPKPPWSNRRLRQLKRMRSYALRTYCRSRCPMLKVAFTQASNRYRLYNRSLYKRYVTRTQRNLRRNPKQFWSFVNSKRKENGLPVEMHLDDRHTSTLPRKCNLFAEHFQTAFNNSVASSSQIIAALDETPRDVIELNTFEISVHHVKSAIDKLKASNSVGPDGIPACCTKKVIRLTLEITVVSHHFVLLRKYSRSSYMMQCLPALNATSPLNNTDSFQSDLYQRILFNSSPHAYVA